MAGLTPLEQLRHQHKISDMDLHFAQFIVRDALTSVTEISLAACLVANMTSKGHACVDLKQMAEQVISQLADEILYAPSLSTWREALLSSPAVGQPGQRSPLILDAQHRLYLYRYWEYEQQLAQTLTAKKQLSIADNEIDLSLLQASLTRVFPMTNPAQVDWQPVAVIMALLQRFGVISGGPGTGKTTTVLKLLALLLEQYARLGRSLKIRLAAPTGKAAARLQEAIRQGKQTLDMPKSILQGIPEEAATLHRLLGYHFDTQSFQYHQTNPLPIDILIVDEASMIDLAMMSRLVLALPLSTRLILLGDKDQLSSVEVGSVFSDICGTQVHFSALFIQQVKSLTGYQLPQQSEHESANKPERLQDALVVLQKSYRFDNDSAIGRLARWVNQGDSDAALAILNAAQHSDVTWRKGLSGENSLGQGLRALIDTVVMEGYANYFNAVRRGAAPIEILALFNQFRMLCALRVGPLGVMALNQSIEQRLARAGWINQRETWYPGRPVMVVRNDYNLQLYNGDIGVVLVDSEADNALSVFFSATGETEAGVRRFSPSRLPPHETVYAMTIHKSQGSEFDRVVIVLGNHRDAMDSDSMSLLASPGLLDESSAILSRELLYTAITRAKHQVEIWSEAPVLIEAIAKRVSRASGLFRDSWGIADDPSPKLTSF